MADGNSNFDSVACSFKIRTPLPPVFFAIEIENLAVMNSRSPIRADSDMWIYCSVLETSANEAVTIKISLVPPPLRITQTDGIIIRYNPYTYLMWFKIQLDFSGFPFIKAVISKSIAH